MAAAVVDVTAVRTSADQAAFFELPYRLYADVPLWVPPLRMADKALMDVEKNPFFAHAEAQHFIATRDGRVVGRIAAIENRRHNEIHEDRVGFFGFFDAEPDAEVTAALLDAAGAWCAERELSPMRGPVNYSTNDSCGVLVEGFDDRPTILMPYNRPDYDGLLQGAGLVPAKDLLAYWIPVSTQVPERFERVVDRRLARTNTTLRSIDVDNFDDEIALLRDLYARCWEVNWGFVPPTRAEFDHAAKDLKQLVDPEMSGIAERDGIPVGFSVFIRDVNELLIGTNGKLLPFHWLKLLLGMKKVRRRRCVLLGVVPEARGGAINEALFIRAIQGGHGQPVDGAEAGWVLEDNTAMRRAIETTGAKVSKRYRLYETDLSS